MGQYDSSMPVSVRGSVVVACPTVVRAVVSACRRLRMLGYVVTDNNNAGIELCRARSRMWSVD